MPLSACCSIPVINPTRCNGAKADAGPALKFLAVFVDICLERGASLPGGLNVNLESVPHEGGRLSIELLLSPEEAQRLMRSKSE